MNYAHASYNMKLSADLVVLSACKTGLGRNIRGEGLVGITRGFMYAGVPRVVVSLWSVSDRATAELMTRFYTKIKSGRERPTKALQKAQAFMLCDKTYSSPFYWAAFTLQGEWR
jgi:CHAT domain-containing protein